MRAVLIWIKEFGTLLLTLKNNKLYSVKVFPTNPQYVNLMLTNIILRALSYEKKQIIYFKKQENWLLFK